MFITYGDTFLPTPSSYDELYYEIIRMHQNFDNLYSMGEYLLTGQEWILTMSRSEDGGGCLSGVLCPPAADACLLDWTCFVLIHLVN